jgi:exonuclease SbcC
MTVSLERIRSKLTPHFPGLEQIDDSVLRFERKSHEQAYAVCYVDVSARIPNTVAALNEYQERIVASRYFRGRKSLQWSNYLFFVVDALPKPELRAVVERDRRYARKFVVTEPELDTALSPPSYKVTDEAIKTDILSTWTNILAASNLDRAILNDESLPTRLELIEQHYGQPSSTAPRSHGTPRASKQPFLRHIVLEDFRPYPQERKFDIGTVTLLFGANGSGKTSILEAIELVYCGQTKRNPKDKSAYKIVATFDNGTKETANNRRAPSDFRDRNLAWYGQYDQKISHLYQAFGRFNFLDTDAAVGLADPKSEADLEEDLSKLLVGPDASKTWREIERTAERVDEKIKELETSRNQADLDFASVNRQIAELGEQKQESNAVLKKLDGLLAEVSWTRTGDDASASVQQLVEALAVYGTLVKQALECKWAGSPVTVEGLRQFVSGGRLREESAEKLVRELSQITASESKSAQELSKIQQSLDGMNELSKFCEADVPRLLAQVEELTISITKHQQNTAGFSADPMQDVLSASGSRTVADFARTATEQLKSVTQKQADSQRRYAEFTKLREESANLAQRLRDVASQMLKNAANSDICPLCHTQFQPGELAKHMHAGIDQQAEAKASELLNEIREGEVSIKRAEASDKTARWAAQACERFGEPSSITASRLLELVLDSQKEAEVQTRLRTQTNEELAGLQKLGLTTERYRRLLAAAVVEKEPIIAANIREKCKSLELAKSDKATERAGYASKSQELLADALKTLNLMDAKPDSVESALSQLKEQVVTTEGYLSKLEPYLKTLPWPAERPLSELAITIGTLRHVAGDFQQTLSKEQGSVKALTEASNQKKQIETRLASLKPRIERFSQAREVLRKIQSEHSLSGAMEKALKQNRTAIEGIFSRIHSPAEFSGLGDTLTTLVRKTGGTATLQQISTGQRAAFALSLFLAQNAQLRTAPPLILIDDPIAHVDDLNCLSFLDYLREVVITGERQVVFATANDKLAALFERKFDFLGDKEFKRHNLAR